MKKISYLFFLFITLMCIGCGKSKSNENVKNNNDTKADTEKFELEELCRSYASNYEIEEKDGDGLYNVKIYAPNFTAIAEDIIATGNSTNLTNDLLVKEIKNYDGNKKLYEIKIDVITDSNIEKAFYDQIVYEMMTVAIKNMGDQDGENNETN